MLGPLELTVYNAFVCSLQNVVIYDTESLRANKVSMFVPYSTLLRSKRDLPRVERETSVDVDEEDHEVDDPDLEPVTTEIKAKSLLRKQPPPNSRTAEPPHSRNEDNVFICGDTQVILRINDVDERSEIAAGGDGRNNNNSNNGGMANKPDSCSEVNEKEGSLVKADGLLVDRRSKMFSRRMTRRLICPISPMVIFLSYIL